MSRSQMVPHGRLVVSAVELLAGRSLSFPYKPIYTCLLTEDRSHFPAYQTSVVPSTPSMGDRTSSFMIRPARLPAVSTLVVPSYLEDVDRAFLRMNSGSHSPFERTPVAPAFWPTNAGAFFLMIHSSRLPPHHSPVAPSDLRSATCAFSVTLALATSASTKSGPRLPSRWQLVAPSFLADTHRAFLFMISWSPLSIEWKSQTCLPGNDWSRLPPDVWLITPFA